MKIEIVDNFFSPTQCYYARNIAYETDPNNSEDHDDRTFNDLISDVPRIQNKEFFEERLNEELYMVDNRFRKFNVVMKDHNKGLHIHHDDCDFIGVVYLNENYGPEDGTTFWRHRETGISYRDLDRFGGQNVSESARTKEDILEWEPYLNIQARTGRLLILEPLYYHSESRVFGEQFDEARCVEIFHMIKKSRLDYWTDYYDLDEEDYEVMLD